MTKTVTSLAQIPEADRAKNKASHKDISEALASKRVVVEEGGAIVEAFLAPKPIAISEILFWVERCPESGVKGIIQVEARDGSRTTVPLNLPAGETIKPLGPNFTLLEGTKVLITIDTPCIVWYAFTYSIGR